MVCTLGIARLPLAFPSFVQLRSGTTGSDTQTALTALNTVQRLGIIGLHGFLCMRDLPQPRELRGSGTAPPGAERTRHSLIFVGTWDLALALMVVASHVAPATRSAPAANNH